MKVDIRDLSSQIEHVGSGWVGVHAAKAHVGVSTCLYSLLHMYYA